MTMETKTSEIKNPFQLIDINSKSYFCGLIYGPNGGGKTQVSLTLPGKIALIDWDANPQIIKKFPKADQDRITVLQGPATWNEITLALGSAYLDQFDGVVWDNLTGLYRVIVYDAMKAAGKPVPSLHEYGLASERLRIFVNLVKERSKKQHTIVICHTQVTKDEVTGAVEGNPALPGQVPPFVISKFPEIIFMKENGAGKFEAHFSKEGTVWFPATTRELVDEKGNRLKKVESPNLTTLYKLKPIERGGDAA